MVVGCDIEAVSARKSGSLSKILTRKCENIYLRRSSGSSISLGKVFRVVQHIRKFGPVDCIDNPVADGKLLKTECAGDGGWA